MNLLEAMDELNKINENLKALDTLAIALGERIHVDGQIMPIFIKLIDDDINGVEKVKILIQRTREGG